VVIEQEMGEKIGSDQKGSEQRGGVSTHPNGKELHQENCVRYASRFPASMDGFLMHVPTLRQTSSRGSYTELP
jgi:hypothetical protein